MWPSATAGFLTRVSQLATRVFRLASQALSKARQQRDALLTAELDEIATAIAVLLGVAASSGAVLVLLAVLAVLS